MVRLIIKICVILLIIGASLGFMARCATCAVCAPVSVVQAEAWLKPKPTVRPKRDKDDNIGRPSFILE